MAGERWRSLDVWKLADQLAQEVYRTTRHFPRDEQYGITAQLRRASLSIPANIVEGYSRKGEKELTHFLNIAVGSLAETKYLLHFARCVDLLKDTEYPTLDSLADRVGAKLWAFYRKVRGEV